MTQHLIGISGAKGAGKNTFARLIETQAKFDNKTYIELSFAAKMKAAAARSLGFSGTDEELVQVMNECKEHWQFAISSNEPIPEGMTQVYAVDNFKTFTGRQYLQWFGTEGGRGTYGDEFWIDAVLPNPVDLAAGGGWVESVPAEMVARRYPEDYVVITDARFENEARRIKALGGTLVEITRPGYDADGHASEAPLPRELVDFTVVNDGDILALQAKTNLILLSL